MLIIILQIIPLPEKALSIISPSTIRVYKTFADDAFGTWRALSLYPGATIDEIFKVLAYSALFLVIINHYRTKSAGLEKLGRDISGKAALK